ncbi:MAG TPA: hypothetical protein VF618_00585, partial [Thermoanaerobaculia bacterium]
MALFLLCAVFLPAAGAFAQSCPPPTIVQIGGTNPSCAGQAVTLDAGDGYASYLWSNGATTRIITDAPTAAATYSVTVTDANGCSATSTPLAVEVHGEPPQIMTGTELCPGSTGYAHVWNTWYPSYHWTIAGGMIWGDPYSSGIQFNPSAGSSTVVLTVTATDSDGCTTSSSRTVNVGAAESMVVHSDSTACPNGYSVAMVAPFPGATAYHWTITGGRFLDPPTNYAHYIADGSGTVHLQVTADTNNGCTGFGSADIPIDGGITFMYADGACVGRVNTVSASMPGFYSDRYEWTVTNAQRISSPYESYIQFIPDGSGPVGLQVKVTRPERGCVITTSTTVPLLPAATPQIVSSSGPTVCPGGTPTLTVANASSFDSLQWQFSSVTNTNVNGATASFTANQSGVAVVKVTGTIGMCSYESTLRLPIEAPNAAISMPSAVCGNSTIVARVADAGPGAVYDWTVTGGTLVSGIANEATISVPASGTLEVGVSVTTAAGCSSSASATATIGSSLAPGILFNNACPNDATVAFLGDAANYSSITWSISGGSIDGPVNGPTVVYTTASTAPAQLTATVTNAAGCSGSATVAAPPARSVPVPTVTFNNNEACGLGATGSVSYDGPLENVQWTLTNAVITSNSDYYIEYRVISEEPVTATVTALSEGCPVTASATFSRTAPAIQIAPASATLCGFGATSSATATVTPFNPGTASVYWSIENGIITSSTSGSNVTFRATGNPVRLSARWWDCNVVETVEIPLEIAPEIVLDSPAICAYDGVSRASVSGNFPGLEWSITNGVILTNEGNAITFRSDTSSAPVTLSAYVMSGGSGCTAYDSVQVPIRTITPPTITFDKTGVCPYDGTATATVSGTWAQIHWSVMNGEMVSESGNSMTFRSTTSSSPVMVYAEVQDSEGCRTYQSAELRIRTIAPPTITFDKTGVCPYDGTATATVSGTWAQIHWSVMNGEMVTESGNSMTFRSTTSTSPVMVYAEVQDSEGCRTYQSAELAIRMIAPPTITFDKAGVCPYEGTATATVSGTWAQIHWSVTNGQMLSQSGNSMTFQSTTLSSPVTVYAEVQDSEGCRTYQSADLAIRMIAPPTITFDKTSICPTWGTATATVAGTWAQIQWSVTNGDMVTQSGNSMTFRSTTTQPVSVYVSVQDAEGCRTSQQVTLPIRTIDPPAITFDKESICPSTGTGTATVAGTWADLFWSVTNGELLTQSGNSMTFRSTTSEPVTVFVSVGDAEGCRTYATEIVPVEASQPATIAANGPTTFCEGGSVTLTASEGASYLWSNGATTRELTVTESGDYSVTVTSAAGCSTSATPVNVTVTPNGTIAITTAGGNCPNESGTAWVADAGPGATYAWTISGGTFEGGTAPTGRTAPFIAGSNPSDDVILGVTVTPANGCPSVGTATVFVRQPPVAQIVSPPLSLCDTRFFSLTAYDNNPGPIAMYVWSGTPGLQILSGQGSTSASFRYDGPSVPEIVVTLAVTQRNCTVTTTRTIPALLFDGGITASGPTTACNGGSVTLTAPGGDHAGFLWSTGETTRSIVVSTSGTYSVDVSSANGCMRSFSQEITNATPPPVPEITAGGPTTFCEGTGVLLSAPSGYSYLWSNGETTQSIYATQGGSYTVTVSNGCTATSEPVVLTTLPAPVATIAPAGPLTLCAGQSVTLVASEGTAYQWSNGATTRSITVTSGTYAVRVFNVQGCSTESAPVTVTASSTVAPAPSVNSPSRVCPGETATAAVTNPSNFTSYQWTIENGVINGSSTGTSVSYTAGTSGDVKLRVIGNTTAGCATTVTRTIAIGPPPAEFDSFPEAFCTLSRRVVIVEQAGPGATYVWQVTGPATFEQHSVGYRGFLEPTGNGTVTVTVTITGAGGCSSTVSATTEVAVIEPFAIATPATACSATGNTATVSVPNATSYLWSIDGGTITGPANGSSVTYDVTAASATLSVRASNAYCSLSATKTIANQSAVPVVTASATSFCPGGSVTLTAPAGYSAYSWSNGATTASIAVNQPGDYSVTVTTAGGCTKTSTAVSITQLEAPAAAITASGPATFCTGGSVTLTASSAASYLWSNGATTQSISVSDAGSYSVTTTNAAGCSATSAATVVTVHENPAASITAEGPTTFCAGGSVTLTANEAAGYLWSNGATTRSITVSESGSYSVTITDANGCSATSAATSVTVNVNPTASITANGATTFCAGGSVTLTANEAAGYLWSNGATTRSISVSEAGAYSVTITDANGCSATSAATSVTVNVNPTASITADGATTFCAGGSVTLTANEAASYLWSNGATTQSISVSNAGSYSVTVTNAAGCSVTSAATAVTVNATPVASITANGPTAFCAGGSVTLTANEAASYLWSNGATTRSITVSEAGAYSVTITDANGCSAMSAATSVTVNVNPTASITANGATTFCAGGSVSLTANEAASYLWSNGATTRAITVTQAGNYSVTITDANGCSATSAATSVTVHALPAATIAASGATTFCQGESVTLTASAGTNWLWSNGATTQAINVTTAGSYSVTVTNELGCSATSAATSVTVRPLPQVTVSASGTTNLCTGQSVTLTATSNAPFGGWYRDGVLYSTTKVQSVSTGGSYTWRATTQDGCKLESEPIVVTVNARPSVSRGGFGFVCWNGQAWWEVDYNDPAGTIVWTVTDGTIVSGQGTKRIYYTPNAGATSVTLDVTITSPQGCSTSYHDVIPVDRAVPAITAEGPTTFCVGGSVTLTADAAPAGYGYRWSNGTFAQSITVTQPGSYSVQYYRSSSGCNMPPSTPVTVTVLPLPDATITGAASVCPGTTTTLSAPSGSGYSYLWSNGETTQSIEAGAGTYAVTVTANGCSKQSAVKTVTEKALPAATISGNTSICAGTTTTLTAASGSGYTYLWSTGATSPSITVGGGNYYVDVTVNGCTARSATVSVTEKPLPTATISGTTSICAGTTTTLSAATGSGYTYLWSTGATSPT